VLELINNGVAHRARTATGKGGYLGTIEDDIYGNLGAFRIVRDVALHAAIKKSRAPKPVNATPVYSHAPALSEVNANRGFAPTPTGLTPQDQPESSQAKGVVTYAATFIPGEWKPEAKTQTTTKQPLPVDRASPVSVGTNKEQTKADLARATTDRLNAANIAATQASVLRKTAEKIESQAPSPATAAGNDARAVADSYRTQANRYDSLASTAQRMAENSGVQHELVTEIAKAEASGDTKAAAEAKQEFSKRGQENRVLTEEREKEVVAEEAKQHDEESIRATALANETERLAASTTDTQRKRELAYNAQCLRTQAAIEQQAAQDLGSSGQARTGDTSSSAASALLKYTPSGMAGITDWFENKAKDAYSSAKGWTEDTVNDAKQETVNVVATTIGLPAPTEGQPGYATYGGTTATDAYGTGYKVVTTKSAGFMEQLTSPTGLVILGVAAVGAILLVAKARK
jgi:hypothetical protein